MAGKVKKFKERGYNYSVGYTLRGTFPSKHDATIKAALLRSNGHNARVVKTSDGWAVYSLKK